MSFGPPPCSTRPAPPRPVLTPPTKRAQRTLVEQSIPELPGTSYFQGPPRWGWVGELPGSAEGKGDSEFILNPSGHWSCKQAGNSWVGGRIKIGSRSDTFLEVWRLPSRQGPAGVVGHGERGRATPWSPVHMLASDVQRAGTCKPEASRDNTDPGCEDCLGPLPKGCHFVCSQMEHVHDFVQ